MSDPERIINPVPVALKVYYTYMFVQDRTDIYLARLGPKDACTVAVALVIAALGGEVVMSSKENDYRTPTVDT